MLRYKKITFQSLKIGDIAGVCEKNVLVESDHAINVAKSVEAAVRTEPVTRNQHPTIILKRTYVGR